MREIVLGKRVADFVAARAGADGFSEPYTAMGLAEDGEVIGGLVFNSYCNGNIDISIAGEPKAWTPTFVHRLAHYVWDELHCTRASFLTGSTAAGAMIERMGGQPEGVAIDWFGEGRPGIRYVILRKDWRFT